MLKQPLPLPHPLAGYAAMPLSLWIQWKIFSGEWVLTLCMTCSGICTSARLLYLTDLSGALLFWYVWYLHHRLGTWTKESMMSVFKINFLHWWVSCFSRHLRPKVISTWVWLHTLCLSGAGLPWWMLPERISTTTSTTLMCIQSESWPLTHTLHAWFFSFSKPVWQVMWWKSAW